MTTVSTRLPFFGQCSSCGWDFNGLEDGDTLVMRDRWLSASILLLRKAISVPQHESTKQVLQDNRRLLDGLARGWEQLWVGQSTCSQLISSLKERASDQYHTVSRAKRKTTCDGVPVQAREFDTTSKRLDKKVTSWPFLSFLSISSGVEGVADHCGLANHCPWANTAAQPLICCEEAHAARQILVLLIINMVVSQWFHRGLSW